MAFTFDDQANTVGQGMGKRASSRTSGPNPFLSLLQKSYEDSKDQQYGPVAGEQVDYTVKEGSKSAGQTRQKYTGDLAEVISLIRAASNKLGIGAIVQVVPAVNQRGNAIKNQWFVKYMGKDRKAPRKPKDA